ncbi:MAG: hypothetical protein KAS48_05265 [Gammaproteobacteria bacterium]|nr:hypothetical protein [Gammaproteobacteria bacterium]
MAVYIKSVSRGFCILLWAGLLFGLLLTSIAEATRLPSANRECSICHIMWLTEFRRDDVTPLIQYQPKPVLKTGKQDVSSTPRMCFSCHDGFVLDSRFMWKEGRGHNHPVGEKPSDKIKIPLVEGKKLFPLNDDGKMYCGTCHTAHGVDWETDDSPVFMRIKSRDGELCEACHQDKTTGPEKGFHILHRKPDRFPADLKKAGSRLSSKGDITCQSCHRPHAAAEEPILVMRNNDSQLCLTCHIDKLAVKGSKHDMSLMAPDDLNIKGQKSQTAGPCSACHVPHQGGGLFLWARQTEKASDDVISSTCRSCHNKEGPAHKKLVGQYSHPTGVPITDPGIIATANKWVSRFKDFVGLKPIQVLPLYNKNGRRVAKDGLVTCASCHDPHNWAPHAKKTQRKDTHKLKGDGRSSFLRIANDENSSLCINCHREQSVVTMSKHNLDISAPQASNVAGRKVSTDGACSACHLPHKGQGSHMWARKKVDGKQGEDGLCASCHREEGLADKKLVGDKGHPVHAKMTMSATPEMLPLYKRKQAKNGEKGLIECATCHNPHQWDSRDAASKAGTDPEVDGDADTSFLRLPAVAQHGALCTECHN